MHKAILIMLLALMSNSAVAEWVEVDTSRRVGLTTYADPNTIRKSGNKVEMWVLENFNSVQELSGDKYLSQKAQNEFDYKEEQRRLLYFTWHSENMGGGHRSIWEVNLK